MNDDAIFDAMRPLIADSLAIPAARVERASRLTSELGADSLDFIDIIFGIEKRYGVKIREGELEFLSKLDFSSPQVMKQGYLTREAVDRLRSWLPAIGQAKDPDKITPAQLFSFITVDTLCGLVKQKLEKR